MEVVANPNNTNTFPYRLTLHIYKSILLFIGTAYAFPNLQLNVGHFSLF